MSLYDFIAITLTLVALVNYTNNQYIRIHSNIAIMLFALFLATSLLLASHFSGQNTLRNLTEQLNTLHFDNFLLQGILSFLLFAGALSVDYTSLKNSLLEISLLSCISTVASAVLFSLGIFFLLKLLHYPIAYSYCLLLGALISPTDPIAVMATFNTVRIPKKIQTCLVGESLFNDGVGIVLFSSIYQLNTCHTPLTFWDISTAFLHQTVGGILYGLLLGQIGKYLIRKSQHAIDPIFVSLALASGGYSLANSLQISGPLAMVCAGILIGNMSYHSKFQRQQRSNLTFFWNIIDEILNAILFLCMGFELLDIKLSLFDPLVIFPCILLLLIIRALTVALPLRCLSLYKPVNPHMVTLLTWGGLRGGLALALALSLPNQAERDIILLITYGIVAFSTLVQGLTMPRLARYCTKK